MAILPVSSVGLEDKSNISFAHKSEHKKTNNSKGTVAPLGKTIPVMVLMAMNPSLLNTAATANGFTPDDVNENLITMVVPTNTPDIDDATYVIEPEELKEQQSYPLGVAYFSEVQVQKIQPAIGGGARANIVLTGSSTGIDGIYYVKNGYRDNSAVHKPPEITGLIYHNTGDGKEFMGIEVYDVRYKDNTNIPSKIGEYEVKIDDKSAQLLVDLLLGRTQWTNYTILPYKETTSPYLKEMKVY